MEYSFKEELANAISHGVGIVFSLVALVTLVAKAVIAGGPLEVTAAAIFGTSMFLLYVSSTLLHSVTHPKVKRVLEIIDHISIYLLIAGSYTPFVLIILEGTHRFVVLSLIWGLAIGGILFKVFYTGKFHHLSTGLYLVMGWLIIFFIEPVYAFLQGGGFILLVVSGLLYSIGTIFYQWRLFPYHHMVWHLFVLAGSVTMYACIIGFVI
ncbi:MAG: PAQR family membrane homeostasis protein TrhA [Bacilli bacterium]